MEETGALEACTKLFFDYPKCSDLHSKFYEICVALVCVDEESEELTLTVPQASSSHGAVIAANAMRVHGG